MPFVTNIRPSSSDFKATVMVGVVICMLITSTLSAATFSDSTFNVADWTLQTWFAGNGGSIISNQDASQGAAAPSRYLRQQVNPVTDGPNSIVMGIHLKTGGTNPATLSLANDTSWAVDYSLDYRNPGRGDLAVWLAMEQAGRYYVAWNPNSYAGPTGGQFATYAASSLTESDFYELDPNRNAPFDPSSHPSFTSNGPITFGLYTANSTRAGGYTSEYWLDNWNMNVYAVPEPQSLGSALLILAWCLLVRRRSASR